jgi:hypothetical protein
MQSLRSVLGKMDPAQRNLLVAALEPMCPVPTVNDAADLAEEHARLRFAECCGRRLIYNQIHADVEALDRAT